VIRPAPMTASADVERAMPEATGARLDRVQAALQTLRAEERRLERLGLDRAVHTCREQRRYWEFVGALFSIASEPGHGGGA